MDLPKRYTPKGLPLINGGMGSVQICVDSRLERNVAIKQIQNIGDARRMFDELRALQKMRSKHVVEVYDVIFSPRRDEIGIVLEYISGADLFSSPIPFGSRDAYLRTLWQIASGISDIHAVGVIHRDIKPNNMKIDAEQVVKIFDFGLARDVGPSANTRGFVGTPGFAAPELFQISAKFSQAIDVYAFGATALFLSFMGLPKELLQSPPSPLAKNYFLDSSFGLDVSLADTLARCLAPSPQDRPAMSEVRDLLARHLLRDKHKGLVFIDSPSYLNASIRDVSLRLAQIGVVDVHYDGLTFRVTAVAGEVYINNRPVSVGYELPGSCVVAIGSSYRNARERAFITFDFSHPGVVV